MDFSTARFELVQVDEGLGVTVALEMRGLDLLVSPPHESQDYEVSFSDGAGDIKVIELERPGRIDFIREPVGPVTLTVTAGSRFDTAQFGMAVLGELRGQFLISWPASPIEQRLSRVLDSIGALLNHRDGLQRLLDAALDDLAASERHVGTLDAQLITAKTALAELQSPEPTRRRQGTAMAGAVGTVVLAVVEAARFGLELRGQSALADQLGECRDSVHLLIESASG